MEYTYILIKRKSDGELFRHCTQLAGAFNSDKYDFVLGAYDAGGYLKSRYNGLAISDETIAASERRREVLDNLKGRSDIS